MRAVTTTNSNKFGLTYLRQLVVMFLHGYHPVPPNVSTACLMSVLVAYQHRHSAVIVKLCVNTRGCCFTAVVIICDASTLQFIVISCNSETFFYHFHS